MAGRQELVPQVVGSSPTVSSFFHGDAPRPGCAPCGEGHGESSTEVVFCAQQHESLPQSHATPQRPEHCQSTNQRRAAMFRSAPMGITPELTMEKERHA